MEQRTVPPRHLSDDWLFADPLSLEPRAEPDPRPDEVQPRARVAHRRVPGRLLLLAMTLTGSLLGGLGTGLALARHGSADALMAAVQPVCASSDGRGRHLRY